MADFHAISIDQKLKAFQRAKDESSFNEGTLIIVTEEFYDAALRFCRDSFLKNEPISKSVNMQWSPVWNEIWLNTLKDNLSIALIDDVSGDIIALRGIRIQDKDFKYDPTKSDDQGFKILMSIFKCCEERANFFEKFKVEQAFHFFGFGVRTEYSNRGIGDRLFKVSLSFLRHLIPVQFFVKGDTSSMFSGRVYEKNHFQKLYELPFTEFLMEGKQVICNTGVHRSFKIWALEIHGATP